MPGLATGLGLISPQRVFSGAAGTIDFIASGGTNGATIAPSGLQEGTDLVLGMVFKTTSTAPTHDPTGGALLGSWTGSGSSAIAFWKWAESGAPAFGSHTGGNRSQFFVYRFSSQPLNPIGAVARVAGIASPTMGWAGLTLTKTGSHVATLGYRAADEAITLRPDAITTATAGGTSARYQPMRSDGLVAAWLAQNVAQTVSGVHQSVAVELGYG